MCVLRENFLHCKNPNCWGPFIFLIVYKDQDAFCLLKGQIWSTCKVMKKNLTLPNFLDRCLLDALSKIPRLFWLSVQIYCQVGESWPCAFKWNMKSCHFRSIFDAGTHWALTWGSWNDICRSLYKWWKLKWWIKC